MAEVTTPTGLRRGSEEKYHRLVRAVENTTRVVPCTTNPDAWDGWDRDGEKIPTPEDATAMCQGCPVFNLCRDFARTEKPAIGVYGGEVYGAGLVIAERRGYI